jgi:hypothetical protein
MGKDKVQKNGQLCSSSNWLWFLNGSDNMFTSKTCKYNWCLHRWKLMGNSNRYLNQFSSKLVVCIAIKL